MSGKQNGEFPDGTADKKKAKREMPTADKGRRKPRGSEIGRALRSIYDDTLRESVPDDFQDLLRKLS